MARSRYFVMICMMTSQISKSVSFSRYPDFCVFKKLKTQKSGYLENEILFFLQIKKFINHTSRATLWQKLIL